MLFAFYKRGGLEKDKGMKKFLPKDLKTISIHGHKNRIQRKKILLTCSSKGGGKYMFSRHVLWSYKRHTSLICEWVWVSQAPSFTSDAPTHLYCRYYFSPGGAELNELMITSKIQI